MHANSIQGSDSIDRHFIFGGLVRSRQELLRFADVSLAAAGVQAGD
jgi:hypothetical protein